MIGTTTAIRPAVIYAAQFALFASFGRFSGLFLADFGLSDSQIGMVLTFAKLLSLGTQMYCGVLADRLGTRRVLLWTNLSSSACMAIFPLGYYTPQSWRFPFSLVLFSLSTAIKAPAYSLLDAYTLKYLEQVGTDNSNDYSSLADDTATAADVTAGNETDVTENMESTRTTSATDNGLTDNEDAKNDRKSMYGRERLWGAISWGATSVLLGVMLDLMGFSASFLLLFITTAISTYLSANKSLWLEIGSSEKTKKVTVHGAGAVELMPVSKAAPLQSHFGCDENSAVGGNKDSQFQSSFENGKRDNRTDDSHVLSSGTVTADIKSDVVSNTQDEKEVKIGVVAAIRVLLTDWRTVLFLYTVMAMGACMTLVEALLFLFFRQELDSSFTLCGISVLITVAFEIPLFYGQKKLTQWFGFTTLTLIGMLSYIVRVGVYTLLDSSSAWLVMTVEPLHGITYSLIQLTQVRRISELVPDHLQSTGQGFMTGCRSVGGLAATLIGTMVMEKYGSVPMYQGGIILSATAMLAFVCATPPKEKVNRAQYEPLEVESE